MANLAARRAPSVSHGLANLNVVRPDRDNGLSQDDTVNFEDDLNLFTNAEFLDFPVDDNALEQSAFNYYDERPRQANVSAKKEYPDGMEMVNNGYHYQGMTELMSSDAVSPVTTAPTQPAYAQAPLPVVYGASNLNFDPSIYSACASQASPTLPPTPTASTSPKVEDDAKAAAEEDKRRRNTAASARFRVKKKQREQALEKREKELTEKMMVLERRIGQLEQENGFLRSLVTEKNGKENVAEKHQRFTRSSEEAEDEERSTKQTRKGVGTKDTGKA